jgi:hypothetical protein
MSEPEQTPEYDPYAVSRKDARKANIILNTLVVISAMAGSAFLLYVAHHILPVFGSSPSVEEVQTSRVRPTVTVLTGEADGLAYVIRDLDDAEAYSRELSARILHDIGATETGLIYRLVVRNTGESAVRVQLQAIRMGTDDGRRLEGGWLHEVGSTDRATPVGALRLAQQARVFELAAGSERQLEFFVPGVPPAMDKIRDGSIEKADGSRVNLRRQEFRTGES